MAVSVLERASNCEALTEATHAHTAAAILWMSGVAAVKLGKSAGPFLAALKGIVQAPGYASTFAYGELIAWVEKNLEPAEEAAFWISVAKVCEGTEKPATLEGFPRWRDAKVLPLDEGLLEISKLTTAP
jgi:hypothetical protein